MRVESSALKLLRFQKSNERIEQIEKLLLFELLGIGSEDGGGCLFELTGLGGLESCFGRDGAWQKTAGFAPNGKSA